MTGTIRCASARMVNGAGARQSLRHFNSCYARAGQYAFGLAMRHELKSLVMKANDFGINLCAVLQADLTGAADGEFEPGSFHHQAGDPRDAAGDLHRLDNREQGRRIAQGVPPARAVGR